MSENVLSAMNRTCWLESMANEKLDILVIGGGITGAGILLDASVRGLNTGLLEKEDFAFGSSSRSTKLIHGGLRYLKQGEIKLVREVGRERAILYRNASHIVHSEKMLLPLVKNGTYGKLATSFGLWFYDRLAGVNKKERRIMLSKQQTIDSEPLLREDIVKGGGLYYEYRTDDARLTLEVLKTAVNYGAMCVNYAQVTEFIYKNEQIIGVKVRDQISGNGYEIYAKKVINAAGPWSDQLRKKDGSLGNKKLHLTKGVHIVVPYKRLPLKQPIYFDVAGGRMIFAIPREGSTYIGTTDTNYTGDIDRPEATKDDIAYLLNAINEMFPGAQLDNRDIHYTWSGLRPLIHEDGKSPSELSRKDEIFISPTGLITIAGGKLTAYRKMAERVVDLAMQGLVNEYNIKFVSCQTDRIVLSGGDFLGIYSEDADQIHNAKKQYASKLTETYDCEDLKESDILSLINKYGTNAEQIIKSYISSHIADVDSINKETDSSERQLLLSELMYGIDNEMVTNLQDFLIRRTSKLLFGEHHSTNYNVLIEHLANVFGWSKEKIGEEDAKLVQELRSGLV